MISRMTISSPLLVNKMRKSASTLAAQMSSVFFLWIALAQLKLSRKIEELASAFCQGETWMHFTSCGQGVFIPVGVGFSRDACTPGTNWR
jgi:hypothetical protein